jgi:uncharacterized membrane protein YbaN (DUF454 family)
LSGFRSVGLGTVFVGLAAACYARASARSYKALLNSPVFGPTLQAWRRDRSVPRGARRAAIGLILLSFGASIGFVVTDTVVRVVLILLALGVIAFVLRLPSSQLEGA